MDLGRSIQESINVYFKNFGVLWIAGLVAALITSMTLGILAGPALGGFMILVLKVIRGERGEFNEIFAHFNQFGSTFFISVIVFGITCILILIPLVNIVAFLINPLITFIWATSLILAIDKKLKPLEAIQQSIEWIKTSPLMLWVHCLVMTVLASIGALACGIGMLVTFPLSLVGMAVAYNMFNTSVVISEGPTINIE